MRRAGCPFRVALQRSGRRSVLCCCSWRGVPLTPNLRTIVPRGSAPTASLQCARLVIKPEKKLNFFLLASKKIH
ncbi:MAG: hypothetical protein J6P19_04880, partial [Acetobacter sp.]|nr:hypothetical protein [Acetobacter sp.]